MNDYTELMEHLPSGVPINDDTWCKLNSWISRNLEEANSWKVNLPSKQREIEIYYTFGCLPLSSIG